MTDNNTPESPTPELPAAEARVAPAAASPQASTQVPQAAPRSSLGVFFVALWALLLSFALAAVSFWFYQDRHQQQLAFNQLQYSLEQRARDEQNSLRELQGDVEKSLVEQQEQVQNTINLLAEELNKNSARVLALTSTSHDQWKLAEAQFLLRLANQRILLEKDSQNALALALSADNILRDVDQPELTQVRQVLAEEIAVLKMVGVVDREGIFLRLAALANRIDGIPFIEPLGSSLDDLDEPAVPANETWRQTASRYFYTGLNKLGNYIRVRDHGKTINAVLPPSQQMYLQQNLRLMLEQAQVALLRNDAQIFQESLIKAQNWINQYYALNTEASAVLAELQSLQTETVAPELTDFHNASVALADYIERREKQAAARRGGR